MAIGRTFKESIQKAFRSLEVGLDGLEPKNFNKSDPDLNRTKNLDMSALRYGTCFRLLKIIQAFKQGKSVEEIYRITSIDPWFLQQIKELSQIKKDNIQLLKEAGFSDIQIGRLLDKEEDSKIRSLRKSLKVIPSYKVVDTCAGEFIAKTHIDG